MPARDRVRYRPVTDADLAFLARLYASTREDELRIVPWTADEKAAFLAQQFRAQKIHYDTHYPECQFSVIEEAGVPIGRLYLDRAPDLFEIIDIALLPEHRGHGLGRILMQEILDEARTAKLPVSIYVEHTNPARHLYDRLGFLPERDEGVYLQMMWRPS